MKCKQCGQSVEKNGMEKVRPTKKDIDKSRRLFPRMWAKVAARDYGGALDALFQDIYGRPDDPISLRFDQIERRIEALEKRQ
jgi:hypothetical protein